ncbi:hypothetical protein CA983_00545 [Streptomyces swartbergensis]|uniref:Uncharacterized protein n=1 Tax=Streptomyces swartbergensis TaxID=487165 RepID=A0A2C9ZNQ0_9ACTN|nr:hypothetical protein CA983_00545 [Streptomyces swartbergensis]
MAVVRRPGRQVQSLLTRRGAVRPGTPSASTPWSNRLLKALRAMCQELEVPTPALYAQIHT